MKLSPIVAQLRLRCSLFAGRVFGGIDWESLEDASKLPMPAAYVIVTDDDPDPNKYQNVAAQDVKDGFDVCVVLEAPDNKTLERVDQVHDVRALLHLALVGWPPMPNYDPVEYEGGQLVLINRYRLVYRFSFSAGWTLGRTKGSDPPETWEEWQHDGFPRLEGIDIDVDAIDPMVDKNLKQQGPDGRIELTMKGDLPQ
ncbi:MULTISPECIES: hypothetical protein [unclassified Herbaspirillum]|uniref:phage tail terminator protein n=1 Tax=unclassified Herbaspirillum TaxID=2624150 RepID=UPI000E2F01E1|nr:MULTISPECIES: hypothetical protein [unclassified Herbaspirillum]RFB73824.1 hypothetical protein DZB54_06000 [Herbaspirillum sp. 3R-3a1]TFI10365.1 hypothetical protein E4P32_02170 [Herbaspirillum sp. 3R11]TFI16269.1 hypothetical protein E4P31_02175 [Herbaspirillum sp. 3R-11]TFI28366.1 hypothetical protein E4P30_08240 [Herbaspirillum sp. 3C11]